MIYLNLKSDSSGGAQAGGAAGLGPSHGGAQGLATNAHRHGPADRAGAPSARPFGDRESTRPNTQRMESKADNADSWRRGGREEQSPTRNVEENKRGVRSYREERSNQNPPSESAAPAPKSIHLNLIYLICKLNLLLRRVPSLAKDLPFQ